VKGVNNVRQTKIHSAEPEPSVFDVQTTLQKLNRYKSPGIHQIPAELIKAGGRTVRSQIHKLVNFIKNKDKLPEEWKESIIVPIYKNGDKTDK
jgi:hypothetical protein